MDLKTEKFEIDAYSGVTLLDKEDNYYTGKRKAQKANVYVSSFNNDKEMNILVFDLKQPDNFIIEQLIEGTSEAELRSLYNDNKKWFKDIFMEKIADPSYNGEL